MTNEEATLLRLVLLYGADHIPVNEAALFRTDVYLRMFNSSAHVYNDRVCVAVSHEGHMLIHDLQTS